MNVDDEFSTIDLLLASQAETRGVDAFTLAMVKVERQTRKLFTHVVYQSPAFGPTNIPALRDALADRNDLYWWQFVQGWDKLYQRSFADLVGEGWDQFLLRISDALKDRNKVFHGQLTSNNLSREDLIAHTMHLRCWCQNLAIKARREVSYDGFERDSFQKSVDHTLAGRLNKTFGTVNDYESFLGEIAKLQRTPPKPNPNG